MSKEISVKKFIDNDRLKEKAKELLNNEEQLGSLLKAVAKMASNKNAFKEILETIMLFISLIKDYAKGDYREIPMMKVVLILASLIYALSPLDFIPDSIPGIGSTDDIAILAYVCKKVYNELEDYKIWKERFIIAA
ncbi:DUF1232 domain-containing protein [Mycoplasmatota bacterium zrk1]